MLVDKYLDANLAYDILLLAGKNGCTVFPEGLCAMLSEPMFQRLSNRMVNWIQEENATQKKRMPKQKKRLDLIADAIVQNLDVSVEDYEDSMENPGELEHLCNKIWNYWMSLKKKITAEELDDGLTKTLGKFKKTTESRICGDHLKGKNVKLSGIVFTSHAIERAKMRVPKLSGHKSIDVASWMLNDLKCSEEVECAKRWKAVQLLNHRLEAAKYFLSKHGFLYVVVNDVVKTMHLNESKRFRRKLARQR